MVDIPETGDKPKENEQGELTELKLPEFLPLLPVRDIVVFPYMILPLYVGRDLSVNAVNEALASGRVMILVAQKDQTVEDPAPGDLYGIGTIVTIIRMVKMPDQRVKILVQGLIKGRVKEFVSLKPYYKVSVERFEDEAPDPKEVSAVEVEALIRSVKDQMSKLLEKGKMISPDILAVVESIDDPGKLADLVASNLGLKVAEAQNVLETASPAKRLKKVGEILGRELELLTIQEKIQTQAHDEFTKAQRDYFLREQMRQIQKELGDTDERSAEITELRDKIKKAELPEIVAKEVDKQVVRFAKMHPDSAEATTVRTYLDWILDVPWSVRTKDNIDINKAKKVLDEDHYDLEKIKERILEYLGVAKLKKDMKGPILCFLGPPGTGKTSLGKSIARALGRKFVRMSLGGVRDESEIRGHRRTYIGALPGRIIQGFKQAGSNNPVFMLDEIDKLGSDFRGDPSSALLEVLDPEQNHSFQDHYLALPFDLSKTLFLTTANVSDTIPPALRDRMEIIQLSGYTEEEKLEIAKKYVVPKQIEANGMTPANLKITDGAIRGIINDYTREAGLRNLERELAKICRKHAVKVAKGRSASAFQVTEKDLRRYLGVQKFQKDDEKEKPQVGVATGLAWTQFGGEIMHIEVTTMKGKGVLTLTGKLGEVMRESAQAAFSYCRANAAKLGIKPGFAGEMDVHIHVPAGAIPKDGPSAGITIAVALASALSGRPVRNDVAMTGEITLRGRVLPIGGLKEKTLAAMQAGITSVMIPYNNIGDLSEIPDYVKKKVKFIPVKTVENVLKHAFDGALAAKADGGKKDRGRYRR
ncbi:MAG: endopeptidase La [Nitrospinae bacterium]|nr:endopeptidase La [Nitrospinota bacterium]